MTLPTPSSPPSSPTPRRSRVIPVLLAALVLVGGANPAAWAANGTPLLIGHGNKAPRTTKLTSKKGPALRLTTKDGSAPLEVSSSIVVAELNADTVDGKSATDLGPRTILYPINGGASPALHQGASFPGLAPGTYLATYDVAADFGDGVDATLSCAFDNGPGANSRTQGRSSADALGGVATVQSTFVFTPQLRVPMFGCVSDKPFTFDASGLHTPDLVSEMSFIPLASVAFAPAG